MKTAALPRPFGALALCTMATAVVALLAAHVSGAATAPTVTCPGTSSTAFAQWGDQDQYTLAPNGDFEAANFATTSGWTLAGGAAQVATALLHGGNAFPRITKRRPQVDGKRMLPVFIFHIAHRPIGHLSEVVHQNVNATQPGDSFLDGSLDRAGIEHIGLDGKCASTAGLDLPDHLRRLFKATPA